MTLVRMGHDRNAEIWTKGKNAIRSKSNDTL